MAWKLHHFLSPFRVPEKTPPLREFQVLKRAATAWCDFGMPSVAPEL